MAEEGGDQEGAGDAERRDLRDRRGHDHDPLEDDIDTEEGAHERDEQACHDSIVEDRQRFQEGHPVPLDEEEVRQDGDRSHEVHDYLSAFGSLDPCANRNFRPPNECTSTLSRYTSLSVSPFNSSSVMPVRKTPSSPWMSINCFAWFATRFNEGLIIKMVRADPRCRSEISSMMPASPAMSIPSVAASSTSTSGSGAGPLGMKRRWFCANDSD